MRVLHALVVLVAMTDGVWLTAQSVTFRGGVDLTTFAVSITDKKGELVGELTKDDFEVFEDGRKQAVQYFAKGDGEAAPELHLGLLCDAAAISDHPPMRVAARDVPESAVIGHHRA